MPDSTSKKPARTVPTSRGSRSRKTTVPARLFDVTRSARRPLEGTFEYVPLEHIRLAKNPRRDISPEGIDRLAGMLMSSGQLEPAIGRRLGTDEVVVYAGQRRFLAAQRSVELAGTDGFEGLKPVDTLLVRLLDYNPTEADIRRIQAQENQHEDLSLRDKQDQFADCWLARTGGSEDDRLASVCVELGYDAKLAWNLRRQLTLPDELRGRVSERPSGDQLSITMANRLADMGETSPSLMHAVAARITTADHHQQALNSIGEFVQRTVVEQPDLYAVRLEEGAAVLDGHEQIERARAHLSSGGRETLVQTLGCEPDKLELELQALSARAQRQMFRLDVDRSLRDRAAAGRYAWVHERGADYAAAMWVIAPEFMIAAVHEALAGSDSDAAMRDESYFGAADAGDEETEEALANERARREEIRKLHEEAANSNLGLGYDISTGLLEPRGEQLDALRSIVVRLLSDQYPSIIAYGAGWTSRERQQPVGDTGRFEPLQVGAIVDAELARALEDPDPLRGILQFVSRWAAAFVLDPNGVPRTTALGSDRMARKVQAALPAGESPLRSAVWQLMRPMLSPRLAEVNRDEFVLDDTLAPAADMEAARADSALEDIDLGEEQQAA
jgi:ParB-like nuclease family protein